MARVVADGVWAEQGCDHACMSVLTCGEERISEPCKIEHDRLGGKHVPAGKEGEICAARMRVFSKPRIFRKLASAHSAARCRKSRRNSQEHEV